MRPTLAFCSFCFLLCSIIFISSIGLYFDELSGQQFAGRRLDTSLPDSNFPLGRNQKAISFRERVIARVIPNNISLPLAKNQTSELIARGISSPFAEISNQTSAFNSTYKKPLLPKQKAPGAQRFAGYVDPFAQTQATIVPNVSSPRVFEGLGNGILGNGDDDDDDDDNDDFSYSDPPDPCIAIGRTQLVQTVNNMVAVFHKSSGTLLATPIRTASLFLNLGDRDDGGCACDDKDGLIQGDAIVRYDRLFNRWIITQMSAYYHNTQAYQCVAVSVTADALGTYYLYKFGFDSLPDYGKLSVWPGSYVITYSMIDLDGTRAGSMACAYNRQHMISNAATIQKQCTSLFDPSISRLIASDVDSAAQPLPTAPVILVGLVPQSTGTSIVIVIHWNVGWGRPTSTFTLQKASFPRTAFHNACAGFSGGSCVSQPTSGSPLLSVLGDRPMMRLAYRRFPTYDALVFSHTVEHRSTTGIRWYELRRVGTTVLSSPSAWVVFQRGTYVPDTTVFRFMPSIAMDKKGNIAVGYSASSSSVRPSIRYAARAVTDPVNALGREVTLKAGTGVQTNGNSRWGDYTNMDIDLDECTFYYVNQYYLLRENQWRTAISSFKFRNC
mmetsp:Transcript_4273/g.6555  ORF Transcript_4273/g.6555 Transcript_4273/m.6555 type:complete len:611 (+) Transcript_4273:344-2176(+)